MRTNMENYINRQLSYSEMVKIVEKLSAESKIQLDYAENDPTKKSHILNRLCYETGEPAKVYTPTSYNIQTTKFLVNAGLATNEIINEEDLSKYSITVELRSGKQGAEAPQTVEYNLSRMQATKTYSNGKVVGCKYTIPVGLDEFYDARIYVIHNYDAYNAASVPEDTNDVNKKTKFTANGVYVCKGEYDTFGGDDPKMYTNYTMVKSLNKISTLKIHRLPNKFISLLTHKDFKALKETVEGISFDTLPDRPFGDDYTFTESIKGAPENSNHIVDFNGEGGNWTAYQVTESTYTKDRLLGGIVEDVWDKYTIDESHIIDESADGLTVKIDGIYNINYIWIAYTKNYQPEGFDEPLPDVGMYWSYWTAESGQESNRPQQLDLKYIGIKKLDNEFLDLPNNDDFKALRKRVEEGGLGDPVRTTGTGVAYEATVPGITELKEGVSFLMKPHVENTEDGCTLNVNGLGAKNLAIPDTRGIARIQPKANYIATYGEYRVVYDGQLWVLADCTAVDGKDIITRVSPNVGGVPETSAANAGKVLTTGSTGQIEWQTPSNADATVDKITYSNLNSEQTVLNYIDESGISWGNRAEVEIDGGELHYVPVDHSVPIVAGENVTFEVDEENQVVKINAEGGTSDIVVPAKGSRGQANFVESIPGLLKLYNESCGLGVDNYGQVGVVAATNQDIDAGTSMRKPIVPGNFAKALDKYGLHFKIAIIEKNGTFAISPGMIALVLPWDKASFYDGNNNPILTNGGTSLVFASDIVNDANQHDSNGNKYWMAILSIAGLSSTSKHNSYPISSSPCYFKNAHSDSSGSGRAYIYYIG